MIHNNESWGVIRQGQSKQFGFELGTALEDTTTPPSRGSGCHGEQVSDVDGVAPAIDAPREWVALGDRLPNPFRPSPRDGGVREHEPLRHDDAKRRLTTWPT